MAAREGNERDKKLKENVVFVVKLGTQKPPARGINDENTCCGRQKEGEGCGKEGMGVMNTGSKASWWPHRAHAHRDRLPTPLKYILLPRYPHHTGAAQWTTHQLENSKRYRMNRRQLAPPKKTVDHSTQLLQAHSPEAAANSQFHHPDLHKC